MASRFKVGQLIKETETGDIGRIVEVVKDSGIFPDQFMVLWITGNATGKKLTITEFDIEPFAGAQTTYSSETTPSLTLKHLNEAVKALLDDCPSPKLVETKPEDRERAKLANDFLEFYWKDMQQDLWKRRWLEGNWDLGFDGLDENEPLNKLLNKKEGTMARLSPLAKNKLDKDTQALIEVGVLRDDLTIKNAGFVLDFLVEKYYAELAEKARQVLTENAKNASDEDCDDDDE